MASTAALFGMTINLLFACMWYWSAQKAYRKGDNYTGIWAMRSVYVHIAVAVIFVVLPLFGGN